MIELNRELPGFLTNPEPEVYLNDNYAVLDFETTTVGNGLAIYPENRIVSVAWRLGRSHPRYEDSNKDTHEQARGLLDRGRTNDYYVRAGEYELGQLVADIEAADFFVAHNSKFELGWLKRCGLNLEDSLPYDTMLGEYVLGGNQWLYGQLSLNSIAQRRLNEGKTEIVSKMIKGGVPTEDIPEAWLEKYCRRDVYLTERIFLQQRRELYARSLLAVAYNRNLLTPVLADIEFNGMQLDEQLIHTHTERVLEEYEETNRQLALMAPDHNIHSPIQLGEFLYQELKIEPLKIKRQGKWVVDTTPSNRPKVDQGTISKLKTTNKRQEEFLAVYRRHKELYNELTKYLQKFDNCCTESGGLLLARYSQTSTRTHRLSSSGLDYSTQFQNIPRDYKALFRARKPGWVVGECDGAQLEFRVAVHMGRDPVGLQHIVGGIDIHAQTAGVIGCSRQNAKSHTFKPLYYGQSGTDAEKAYYQFFRETYSGIANMQQTWIDEVLSTTELHTEWGLVYHWPDVDISSSGYVKYSTSICNYPVQAFATAEIIPMALVFFWHRLKRSNLQMYIINTIHDSIIAELPEEEIEAFHELSRQCLINDCYTFLDDLYDIKFTVPLGAGVKVASHWNGSDAKDYVPEGMEHDKGEVIYSAGEELWWDNAAAAAMIGQTGALNVN